MSKTQKIILVLLLVVIAVVAVVLVVANGKKDNKKEEKASSLKVSSAEELVNVVEDLYKGKEDDLPGLNTDIIDVKDKDMVNSYTGLKDGSNLEYLVVSEPFMSSQAYSLVIAKVKEGKDANSIAKEMSESVDTRKWICVSAEKLYATSSGDLVFLVMASEDWAKPVYDEFKKLAGNVGKEYEKTEELPDFDDFEQLPTSVDAQ